MAARWDKEGPFELALLCLGRCCGATVHTRNEEESTHMRSPRGAPVIEFLSKYVFGGEDFAVSTF